MGSLLGYLVLDQPRQRLSHWVQALAPLAELGAPQPLRVDGYYLAGEDRALLGLWFLTGDTEASALVAQVARLAEISLIDPSQLAEPDRRALLEKLQGSEVAIEQAASVPEVLADLVKRGRELRVLSPARTITDRALASASAAVAGGEPALSRSPTPRTFVPPPPPAQRERSPAPPDALAQGTARGPLAATRAEVAQASPLLRDEVRRPVGTRTDLAREPVLETNTDPFALAFEATAPSLEARVLRGSRWLPAQLSYVSLDRLRLASVAVPRLRDRVLVSVSFADAAVTLTGDISYVSDDLEAQHTGVAAFELTPVLDEGQRGKLGALLRRARAAHAQLRPPPPRASQRFSVTWPVTLATSRGSIRAELHDVSDGGMFVSPLRDLELSGSVGISLVLDDLLSTVTGRAQVLRQLGPTEARQRGLRLGYGLALTELAEPARLGWERFVARVRRRSARRVLVCAAAARFEEISASLTGAGYTVCGGPDPGMALRLAELEPPDASVLDGDWASGATPGWLAERLVASGVRCLTTHGDARRAYGEVDRLLGVQ